MKFLQVTPGRWDFQSATSERGLITTGLQDCVAIAVHCPGVGIFLAHNDADNSHDFLVSELTEHLKHVGIPIHEATVSVCTNQYRRNEAFKPLLIFHMTGIFMMTLR
jgi:hypothetical protein